MEQKLIIAEILRNKPQGIKIMAASKKDAIKKYNHRKK